MKVVLEFDVEEIYEGDVEHSYRHIPKMIQEALSEYIEKRKDPKKFYQKQCGSKKKYLQAKKDHPWDLHHLFKRVKMAKVLKKLEVYIIP